MTTVFGTLSSLTSSNISSSTILSGLSGSDVASFRTNFGSYRNFVFFNSAERLFNNSITKIQSEFPFDGTRDEVENYFVESTQYDNYVYLTYPKFVGIGHFTGINYVTASDLGDAQIGNGSITIEFWMKSSAGSNPTTIIQKISASSTDLFGYQIAHATASSDIRFRIFSGSTEEEVFSTALTANEATHIAAVYDKPNAKLKLFENGKLLATTTLLGSDFGNIFHAPVPVLIASGNIQGGMTIYTGSLDEIKINKFARPALQISCSYNLNEYATDQLGLYLRFNEGITENNTIDKYVIDHSGKSNHGEFIHYSASNRSGQVVSSSGVTYVKGNQPLFNTKVGSHKLSTIGEVSASSTFLTIENPSPILYSFEPNVRSFTNRQKFIAQNFDGLNTNIITNLVPGHFIDSDELEGDVFKNFLFSIATILDQFKVTIENFTTLYNNDLTDFNVAPDQALYQLIKQHGIDPNFSFFNASALEQLFGQDIDGCEISPGSSLEIVRNEFLRRLYNSLPYLLKQKGSRKSIEHLYKVFGLREKFAYIKEYYVNPFGIGEGTMKSSDVTSLLYMSASSKNCLVYNSADGTTNDPLVMQDPSLNGGHSIEFRAVLPTSGSVVTASYISKVKGDTGIIQDDIRVFSTRLSSSTTASLGRIIFTSASKELKTPLIHIFDDNAFIHVTFGRGGTRFLSGTTDYLTVHKFKNFEATQLAYVTSSYTNTSAGGLLTSRQKLILGAVSDVGTLVTSSEGYFQEFRAWDMPLKPKESFAHTRNFNNFGVYDIAIGYPQLRMHTRIDDNVTASSDGDFIAYDLANMYNAPRASIATGSGFPASENPWQRKEIDYLFTPASIGITAGSADKIRIRDDLQIPTKIQDFEQYKDLRLLTFENNMVDELSEELANMFSSFSIVNNLVGKPKFLKWEKFYDLEGYKNVYFNRMSGSRLIQDLNFEYFMNAFKFIDSSFYNIVEQFIPAAASHDRIAFTVENHILDRDKVQYRPPLLFLASGSNYDDWATSPTTPPTTIILEGIFED